MPNFSRMLMLFTAQNVATRHGTLFEHLSLQVSS